MRRKMGRSMKGQVQGEEAGDADNSFQMLVVTAVNLADGGGGGVVVVVAVADIVTVQTQRMEAVPLAPMSSPTWC